MEIGKIMGLLCRVVKLSGLSRCEFGDFEQHVHGLVSRGGARKSSSLINDVSTSPGSSGPAW